MLAHAHHIGMAQAPIECEVWLRAIAKAVEETKAEAEDDDRAF